MRSLGENFRKKQLCIPGNVREMQGCFVSFRRAGELILICPERRRRKDVKAEDKESPDRGCMDRGRAPGGDPVHDEYKDRGCEGDG